VDRLSCHIADGSHCADNFRRFQIKALPKMSMGETVNFIVDRGRMEADENYGQEYARQLVRSGLKTSCASLQH
jgi:hypothetical protein